MKKVSQIKKQVKGITLVAIVVTIIILLILVGITINLVFNDNSVIKKAQEAADIYEDATVEEIIEIYKLDKNLGDNKTIKDKLIQDGFLDVDTLEQNGIANLTDNIIVVANFEGLKVISNNVNNNDIDYDGKKIYLINDIDCGAKFNEETGELIQGENFTPIGDSNVTAINEETEGAIIKEFNGIFDGLDYRIKNLYIKKNNEADFCTALFGYVGEKGIIENVKISNSYIHGYYETGAIVGRNRGIIRNCINESKVIGDYFLTGGIAGRNCNTIENCVNQGKIYGGSTQTGGIVANCDFGNQVVVKNCKNFGDINATGSVIGGIVGGGYRTNEGNNVTITNCENKGAVGELDIEKENQQVIGGIVGDWKGTILQNCDNKGNISGYSYVGGIVGNNEKSQILFCNNAGKVQASYSHVGGIAGLTNGGTIRKSYNIGYIFLDDSGFYGAGGICGVVNSSFGETIVEECYNTGEVYSLANLPNGMQSGGITGNADSYNGEKIEITNCYNTGYVHGIGAVGGITGYARKITLENCYNIGNVEQIEIENAICGGIIGYIEGEDSIINNNYWLDICGANYGIASTNSNEETEPKTKEQMKSLDTILGDAYLKDLYNKNNGYPILK